MNTRYSEQDPQSLRKTSEIRETPRRVYRMRQAGAVALIGVAGFGLYKGAESAINQLDSGYVFDAHLQVDGIKPVTATAGDTVWDIIQNTTEYDSSVDIRDIVNYVQAMPDNEATFEDGILQEGEQVIVPSVVTKE